MAQDEKQALRVLYSFPHALGRTGVGVTAWHQVRGLVERGLRVTVYTGTCARPVPGAERVVETIRFGPLRLPARIIGRERVWAFHDRGVARALRAGAERFDVVHCWPLGALATLREAKRQGVASVLERPNAHTRFAYEAVGEECRRLGLRLEPHHSHAFNPRRLAREEAEYALADRLACPSEFVARTFLRQGFRDEQLGRHQYGYDPAVFGNGRVTRDPAAPLHVLFAGRCEPRKGLHYALRAWLASSAPARGGRFTIAGAFVPGYRELLTAELAHPSVKDLGFATDMARLMHDADALVLPSIEEGSALVTYEARASGCILVVSDAAGARASHMQDALVHAAGDVAALTEHFNLLDRNADLRRTLRENSAAGAAELTWSAAAERLEGLYRGLAPRPRVAGADAAPVIGSPAVRGNA